MSPNVELRLVPMHPSSLSSALQPSTEKHVQGMGISLDDDEIAFSQMVFYMERSQPPFRDHETKLIPEAADY